MSEKISAFPDAVAGGTLNVTMRTGSSIYSTAGSGLAPLAATDYGTLSINTFDASGLDPGAVSSGSAYCALGVLMNGFGFSPSAGTDFSTHPQWTNSNISITRIAPGDSIILTDSNGINYKLVVDTSGNLSTAPL